MLTCEPIIERVVIRIGSQSRRNLIRRHLPASMVRNEGSGEFRLCKADAKASDLAER